MAHSLENNTVVADRFRIMGHLGSGGFGEVYKAFDLSRQAFVAIKTFAVEKVNRQSKPYKRFQREASILASLQHPHIIKTHDSFLEADMPFISMEFLRGEDLSEVDPAAMTPEHIETIMRSVGQALDHAHNCGFIHRDVKPGNIFLEQRGYPQPELHPVLIDFGIGTRDHLQERDPEWETLTRTNAVVGTPQYMAPEQWKKKELSAQTDIYAFCLIFYELLFGTSPMNARGLHEFYEAHLHQAVSIPGVDRFGRCLSPAQIEALGRGLSKTPRDRPKSCEAITRHWKECQNGAGRGHFSSGWIQLAGVLGLILVLAALGLFVSRNSELRPAEGVTPPSPPTSNMEAMRPKLAPAVTAHQKHPRRTPWPEQAMQRRKFDDKIFLPPAVHAKPKPEPAKRIRKRIKPRAGHDKLEAFLD